MRAFDLSIDVGQTENDRGIVSGGPCMPRLLPAKVAE